MRVGSLILGIIAGIAFIFALIYIVKPTTVGVVVLNDSDTSSPTLDAQKLELAPNSGLGNVPTGNQVLVDEIDISERVFALTTRRLSGELGKKDPQTGKFIISTCKRTLPKGLEVLIAENKDYRLNKGDLIDLPCEVEIAIWPDSPLSISESGYFLINPPTDIMELYYVQAATADLNDFYFDAMKSSKGIFVRRGQKLLEMTPLGSIFLRQMASNNKSIIALQKEISQEYYDEVVADGVQFSRVEHVLDPTNAEADWQKIVSQHSPNDLALVMINADYQVIEKMKKIWRGEDAN